MANPVVKISVPATEKDLERLVLGVDADDCRGRPLDVGERAVEEARRAGLRVGRHLDMRDRHPCLARLNDGLDGVREVRDDRLAQRRLARVGAEPAGGVGDPRVRYLSHHPTADPLQPAAGQRHVPDLADVAVADHDVRGPVEQRLQQFRDVGASVLIVGVGVDDVVGAGTDRGVESRHERGGKSLVGLGSG